MTSKELTVAESAMPASFEELSGMAKAFVASGMFNDVKQLSQAIVKVQAGKELGIPPVYAMQNINMIKGRLCTSANTMALLIKRSGRYNYRITEHTDTTCSITFKELEGDKWVDVGTSVFTMEDARRAKLVFPESAWAKYPRAMLFSRAISQGARLYTPDAIGGVYTSEEIKAIDGPVKDEPEDVPETVAAEDVPVVPEPETTQAEAPATETRVHDVDKLTQTTTRNGPQEPIKSFQKSPVLNDKKGIAPDGPPVTVAEFFAYLQGKGKNYGPTWFYREFKAYTPTRMTNADIVAMAYADVNEMMAWPAT